MKSTIFQTRSSFLFPRALLFLLMWVTFGYFQQGAGWNSNARLALTYCLTEEGSFQIDRFTDATGDMAHIDGHYYSDKAPGTSLFGVPVYAVLRLLRPVLLPGITDFTFNLLVLHMIVFFTVSIISAWCCVRVFDFLFSLGIRPDKAWLTAALPAVCSMIFPYSTLLLGHAPAAAFLFLCFMSVRENALPAMRDNAYRFFKAGLLGGLAVFFEYPAAIAVFFIFIYGVWTSRSYRKAAAFVGGLLIPAMALGVIHDICFGSPFTLGYGSVRLEGFQEYMSKGMYGVNLPRFSVLVAMLFGKYRGFLFHSPFFFLVIPGLVLLWRRTGKLSLSLLFGSVTVYYLLLSSAYHYWAGGSAMGPRHSIGMLFFAGTAGALCLFSRRLILRIGAGILTAYSFIVNFAFTAVVAETPWHIKFPLVSVMKAFWKGELSLNPVGVFEYEPFALYGIDSWEAYINSFNLGELIGLHGHSSLLPLLLFWLVMILSALMFFRRSGSGIARDKINQEQA